ARLYCGTHLIDQHQPIHGRLRDITAVEQSVHPDPQAFVMPPGVQHHDGFVVHTQIALAPRVKELVQGAHTAGEHDERVGAVFHELLTVAHRVADDQLVGVGVGNLAAHQLSGDHADRPATACPGRACHR